jgi:glycosyltransferase involved in cell wall biosynthesis
LRSIIFLTIGPPVVASSRIRVYQYLSKFDLDNVKTKVISIGNIGMVLNLRKVVNKIDPKNTTQHFKIILLNLFVKILSKISIVFSAVAIIRFLLSEVFYSYDIIFIQKIILPAQLILFYKRHGKYVVYDFDDAVYLENGFLQAKEYFNKLVPIYDLVITENEFNAEYIRRHGNNNVLVINGPIDITRYIPKIKYDSNELVIGWIGSHSTQKYVSILDDVFEKICLEFSNVIITLIGADQYNTDKKNIRFNKKNWDINTEVEEIQKFDIGIMPLPDNEWTMGKGGYKLLQYMAIGIPCCASPVGINKQIINDGENGYLASNEEQWYEKLSLLIKNEKLRKIMGDNGRRLVIEYSTENGYKKLKEALC